MSYNSLNIKQTMLFVNFVTETNNASVGPQGPSRRTSYQGVHTAVSGIVLLEKRKRLLDNADRYFVKC